jgi:hypothetical protein
MHRIEQSAHRLSMMWLAASIAFASLLFGQVGTALAQTNTFPSSGNVGVGTTTPASPLQVVGNEPSTDYATLRVKPTVTHGGIVIDSANNSSQVHLRFFKNGVPKWQFRVPFYENTEDLRIWSWTTASDVMSITTGGNVGIGTTNPVIDVNSSSTKYLTVDAGTGGIGSLALGGNTGGTANGVASLAFFNSNLTGADKRIATISGRTNGATNSGAIDFWTFTAGSAVSPRLSILANGNVGVGVSNPQARLEVAGDITATGNIAAKYQDLAEWVPATHAIPAATVVVLNPKMSNQVMSSSHAYDTRVAGVVSAQPGISLGEAGEGKVLVATTGRVKVKVDATHSPIHVGDLLVTSDKDGMAMKSEPLNLGGAEIHRPGTLIGKALEPLESGAGEILVLLSLQ